MPVVAKSRLVATVLTSDGESVVRCSTVTVVKWLLFDCFVYLVTFDDPWKLTEMVSLDFTVRCLQFILLLVVYDVIKKYRRKCDGKYSSS